MSRPPTAHSFGLSRKTTGLTEAHTQLLRLLAEVAVADYLAEVDSANPADEADRKEATR